MAGKTGRELCPATLTANTARRCCPRRLPETTGYRTARRCLPQTLPTGQKRCPDSLAGNAGQKCWSKNARNSENVNPRPTHCVKTKQMERVTSPSRHLYFRVIMERSVGNIKLLCTLTCVPLKVATGNMDWRTVIRTESGWAHSMGSGRNVKTGSREGG